jgi:hypothetical protein
LSLSYENKKMSPSTYLLITVILTPKKITQEYQKLTSTKIEEVLEIFSSFDDIVKTLSLTRGLKQFRLIPAMLGYDAQKMV